MERIDKLLSHEGFGSRKDIRKLLRNTVVLLNDKQIFDCSININPETDILNVDGKIVDLHQNIYLMMNKIKNTVSSNKDGDHQTVFDYLDDNLRTPYFQDKLHLIGRLDIDTEGLLLFTTDGLLTHKLISPKNNISKTYFVVLKEKESDEHKKQIEDAFSKGIHIPSEDNDAEADCKPAKIKWASQNECIENCKNTSWTSDTFPAAAFLSITEGKYHQVKRMFRAIGNEVIYLKRIKEGNLTLDKNLKPGEYKYIDNLPDLLDL